MPVNEKAEWEAYSLPPTPATTVTTASERTGTASTSTKDVDKSGNQDSDKNNSTEKAQQKAEVIGRGWQSALDIFLEKEAAAIAAVAEAEEAAHSG